MKDLERQAIPYELKNDGAIVLVPRDRVTRLRMKLAEGGLPKGGGIGYEIFDKSDTLGATSFVQNINHLRALEGELARTIRAIDRVQAARVHLVLPERPLFSRDKAEPSASIVLKVRGTLEPQQVRAIRHLVASAVNGLKPERVSIVDEAGRLLADGARATRRRARRQRRRAPGRFERRLRDQVESIVSSVVGPGRARVQLTADFDFNRVTQTSDKFDPEGRVMRSSQTREESGRQRQPGRPGHGRQRAAGRPDAAAASSNAAAARAEQEVRGDRQLRDLPHHQDRGDRRRPRQARLGRRCWSTAPTAKNDKGETAYQPRAKEELDRIAALVRSAIGFDQKRGDQVEVVNLRFAEVPADADPGADRLAVVPAVHQGRHHARRSSSP